MTPAGRRIALAEAMLGRPLTGHERARALLASEAEALAEMRAAATPPPACGPEVPVACARPFRVVTFERLVSAATGRRAPDGHLGRATVVAADVFDAMEAAARARHAAAGGAAGAFVPPFAPHQVAAARVYRAVAERVSAGGMRCGSAEASAGRGAGGAQPGPRGPAEAVLADLRWLEAARRAAGGGVALRPARRTAPGRAGPRPILLAALLDEVVVGDRALSSVLRRHGWQPKGALREALRRALAGALDNISRLPPPRPQDVA